MFSQTMLPLEVVWYLYYYLKKDSPDYLTHQLLDHYKKDHPAQVKAFSELAAEAFKNSHHKFDYILRVLGSTELIAGQSRVDSIAKAIHQVIGGVYTPDLLTKKRRTRPLKELNLAERRAELKDVYELSNRINLDGKSILLVDDISTSGTSLKVIAALIKSKYPKAKVYGFLLAKTFGNHPEYGDPDKNPPKTEVHYKEILNKYLPQ